MSSLTIRAARIRDAGDIRRIYNEGIEDRVATLETRLRSRQEQVAWLRARDPRHPVIVAESDGRVRGWASLNSFNARAAYDHVADFSVYVARAARGTGCGSTLLAALIELAPAKGYHKLVLSMFDWNEAGKALYRRHGFREVGVYREQGVLDGRWVNTTIMERVLDDGPPRC